MSGLAACSSSGDGQEPVDPGGTEDDVEQYDFKTPTIVAIAPGQVAVGDKVQIIGSNFIDPDHGTTRVHFSGLFTDEYGGESLYEAELPITYVNPGVAEFDFGPRVLFSPSGDTIGTFRGTATVVSRLGSLDDLTAEEKVSGPMEIEMEVLPSLLIEQLSSPDGDCEPVTEGTLANANLSLGVRAIGMGDASEWDPITFRIHFQSPIVKAMYVRNEWYSQWPLMPTVQAETPEGLNTLEMTITGGHTLFLDPKSRQQEALISPPVMIGQESHNTVKIHRIFAGPLEGNGPAYANFFVEAETSSGLFAERTATLKIWNEGEILPYDGEVKVMERYAAQLVSACFAGGDIGRDLTYTEGESESRTRSLSYRWDVNTALSLGLQVGTGIASPVQFGVNAQATWSQTFGVDVAETVSSERHTGQNLSAHILPTYFGACYRQTERLERTVGIRYHNACGASAQIGEAVLTDWTWGFDIATGAECPPETNLPPAQVF